MKEPPCSVSPGVLKTPREKRKAATAGTSEGHVVVPTPRCSQRGPGLWGLRFRDYAYFDPVGLINSLVAQIEI